MSRSKGESELELCIIAFKIMKSKMLNKIVDEMENLTI